MFSIFGRRAVKKEKVQNVNQDRIANHIFNTIIRLQQKWSAYLQYKTNRLSKAVKIWLLIAFCSISFCYTIYRFKYNFTTKSESVIHLERFLKLHKNNKSDDLISMPHKQAPTDDYRRIQKFLVYMDSLNLTSSGKKIHDSILRDRPGLMDSIHHVEKIFQSQSINK